MKFVFIVSVLTMSIAASANSDMEASPVQEILIQWRMENLKAADGGYQGLVQDVALRSKRRRCVRRYSVLDNYRRPYLDCGILVNLSFEQLRRMACIAEDVSNREQGGFAAKQDPFCDGL